MYRQVVDKVVKELVQKRKGLLGDFGLSFAGQTAHKFKYQQKEVTNRFNLFIVIFYYSFFF